MTDVFQSSMIFNSTLETGLRALCVLSAGEDSNYDLQQLLAFDHILVHSGDLENGPPSLHPNTSQRNGELLVRRPLVTNGLNLMGSKGLLDTTVSDRGIRYTSSDMTEVFLSSLTNQYIEQLRSRAEWAVRVFSGLDDELFYKVFNTAFDRWTTEFQFSEITMGG